MDCAANKMGAAPTAPALVSGPDTSAISIAIPAQYHKKNVFAFPGGIGRVKGGRAYLLDLLIAAKPGGVDRSMTWAWCANLCDTISALRAKGIAVTCHAGTYTLESDVRRIGSVT